MKLKHKMKLTPIERTPKLTDKTHRVAVQHRIHPLNHKKTIQNHLHELDYKVTTERTRTLQMMLKYEREKLELLKEIYSIRSEFQKLTKIQQRSWHLMNNQSEHIEELEEEILKILKEWYDV